MLWIRQHLIWVIIGVVGTVALLGWAFFESYNLNKPKPGIESLDEGRDHVPHGQKVDYKFNPPTGGNHYADWITKEFYDEPREDGSLVHSLEHGYVVINYDCEKPLQSFNLIPSVYAHEAVPESTSAATSSGQLDSLGRAAMEGGSAGIPTMKLSNMPTGFRDGSCDKLKNQLKEIYNTNPSKLIIQPRVGMDSPVILTAWGRMLKLNNFDKDKIKEFIDAFRNNGPEKTVEP